MVREAQGFATKFYTEEGNYDIAGNDLPVIFIEGTYKKNLWLFGHFLHSI
jgi:catalase